MQVVSSHSFLPGILFVHCFTSVFVIITSPTNNDSIARHQIYLAANLFAAGVNANNTLGATSVRSSCRLRAKDTVLSMNMCEYFRTFLPGHLTAVLQFCGELFFLSVILGRIKDTLE